MTGSSPAAGSGSAQHTPQNKQTNGEASVPRVGAQQTLAWLAFSLHVPRSSSGDRACLHSLPSSLLQSPSLRAWCELISCKSPAHPLLSTCCLLHTPACCAQMYFLPSTCTCHFLGAAYGIFFLTHIFERRHRLSIRTRKHKAQRVW